MPTGRNSGPDRPRGRTQAPGRDAPGVDARRPWLALAVPCRRRARAHLGRHPLGCRGYSSPPLYATGAPWLAGPRGANEIIDRIRAARGPVLEQENEERARIADADTAEKQNAASVRLAIRQAVREALNDILGEDREPETRN
jgi:hypothetical protein